MRCFKCEFENHYVLTSPPIGRNAIEADAEPAEQIRESSQGRSSVVEQRIPNPRAEGSIPAAFAKDIFQKNGSAESLRERRRSFSALYTSGV